MNTEQQLVAAFHRKFGHPVALRPALVPYRRVDLRITLISEERDEVEEAAFDVAENCAWSTGELDDTVKRLARFAEELADLVIVTYGAACEAGIDLAPVIAEKMRANMTKDPAALRFDGKQLKGESYVPPDVESIIREQIDV